MVRLAAPFKKVDAFSLDGQPSESMPILFPRLPHTFNDLDFELFCEAQSIPSLIFDVSHKELQSYRYQRTRVANVTRFQVGTTLQYIFWART